MPPSHPYFVWCQANHRFSLLACLYILSLVWEWLQPMMHEVCLCVCARVGVKMTARWEAVQRSGVGRGYRRRRWRVFFHQLHLGLDVSVSQWARCELYKSTGWGNYGLESQKTPRLMITCHTLKSWLFKQVWRIIWVEQYLNKTTALWGVLVLNVLVTPYGHPRPCQHNSFCCFLCLFCLVENKI